MMDLSQAPVMDRFSGENPLDWVIRAERYFTFYNILSEHRLSWASFYLDGEALEWYCWLFRNKQLAGWDHFIDKLFIRFRGRNRRAPDKPLSFLQQFTTVDNYPAQAASVPSWSTVAASPSPQYLSAQLDYNKVNSAHQVFGEKFNGKPAIGVDVETTLPSPHAVKPEGCDENDTILIKTDGTEMLLSQAKEEICHSILAETKEDTNFPVPQYFLEKPVSNNSEAHKVFDEFSYWSKDVVLEPHKVCKMIADTREANHCATVVGNEDNNEEKEIIIIRNEIRQLVPTFVEIPPLRIGSTIASFGDLVLFNMQHGLVIAPSMEEMSGMLSKCRYDQLIQRSITDHFGGLRHAALLLTLHLFPSAQFRLEFPFDPGSSFLTMSLIVTRNSIFCATLGDLDHDKYIMSSLWNSCNWVDTGQERNLLGFLLSKSKEPGREEKIQEVLETFAARYLGQLPNILVNKDDVLLFALFGVVWFLLEECLASIYNSFYQLRDRAAYFVERKPSSLAEQLSKTVEDKLGALLSVSMSCVILEKVGFGCDIITALQLVSSGYHINWIVLLETIRCGFGILMVIAEAIWNQAMEWIVIKNVLRNPYTTKHRHLFFISLAIHEP